MKIKIQFIISLLIRVFLLSCKSDVKNNLSQTTKSKPNIIYILADDLGYSELGSYG